jgi:hypothetical protein
MYNFLSEKQLRLAKFYSIGGTFNLAILILFTRASVLMTSEKLFMVIHHHLCENNLSIISKYYKQVN